MEDPPSFDHSQTTSHDSGLAPHRGRKRKVKRSTRIKRKAVYIIALVVALVLLMALWYYLVNLGQRPPSLILPLHAATSQTIASYVAEGEAHSRLAAVVLWRSCRAYFGE